MEKKEFAKLLKESKDPKFKELHYLINNLYLDLDSFKKNFNTIIRDLTGLFNSNLIGQDFLNECLHSISRDVTVYLNNKIIPVEILIYHCWVCNKYFLEKDGNFLKGEVPITLYLNYAPGGFCSELCIRKPYLNLVDRIVDNPK